MLVISKVIPFRFSYKNKLIKKSFNQKKLIADKCWVCMNMLYSMKLQFCNNVYFYRLREIPLK